MNEAPRDNAIPALSLIPVTDSSSIAAYGYDGHHRILDIKFISGQTYRYAEVTPEIAEAFKKADSQGAYFSRHVRPNFAAVPIPKALPKDPQEPTDRLPFNEGVAWPFPTAAKPTIPTL